MNIEMTAQISGWIGTVLIVSAYLLVSVKRMNASSRSYQWMNLVGAVALGVNVFHQQSWPALALEIVWGAIAIFALARRP